MPGRCPRAETGLAIPAGGDGDTARPAVYLIALSMRLPSSARSKRRGRIIEEKLNRGRTRSAPCAAPPISKRFVSAAAQTSITLKRDWSARYGIGFPICIMSSESLSDHARCRVLLRFLLPVVDDDSDFRRPAVIHLH